MFVKCIKDWVCDNQIGFISGKEYEVNKMEHQLGKTIGVHLKSEQGIGIWFWIGSEYFDLSGLCL